MVRICTKCGSALEKNSQFCVNCGNPIPKDATERTEKFKNEIQKSKVKRRYTLTPSQRNVFLQKILPIMLLGSIIWLISEIIFSTIFIEIEFTQVFLVFYIVMVITEVILFILLYFVSRENKNTDLALLIFFLFSFVAGILSLPIIMVTEFLPQVHMFVSLSVGALLITCFIGLILRDKYFAKGYLWAHIGLFLIGTTLVEIVFILIFNIQNYLLTIPVSLSYILIVALTTMFYGSKVVQKKENEPWMLSFYKIEGVLLLSLIIAIVVVIVVLILLGLGIACGGSDLDFSGFGGGRSKSKKKTKIQ